MPLHRFQASITTWSVSAILMLYTLRDVARSERFEVLKGSGRQLLEFQ